jgi:hypothetical protein
MSAPARVTVARTEHEVARLRSSWNRAGIDNIDSDIDYFLAVVRSSPDALRPHVLMIERERAEPVIAVARLVNRQFGFRLGYREIARVSLRTLVVSFDGILGARTEQDIGDVLGHLRCSLRKGEADALLLQQVEAGSQLIHRVYRDTVPWLRHQGPPVVRWTAKPAESWDALLAQRSSKSRQRLRRYDSQFRRKYGDRAVVRRLDLPEHRHLLERDLESVSRKTYQRGLGVAAEERTQRALRSLGLDQGWLRCWALYIDDQPVAFWYGCVYRGVYYGLGTPGYDPAFANDRVGYICMRHMLEDLCLDDAVSLIDFGYGDADYKQRFGTESSTSFDVMLMAARTRPLLLKAVLTLNGLARRAATELEQRSERVRTLKRRWRFGAARGPADGPGTETESDR